METKEKTISTLFAYIKVGFMYIVGAAIPLIAMLVLKRCGVLVRIVNAIGVNGATIAGLFLMLACGNVMSLLFCKKPIDKEPREIIQMVVTALGALVLAAAKLVPGMQSENSGIIANAAIAYYVYEKIEKAITTIKNTLFKEKENSPKQTDARKREKDDEV